MIMVPWWITEAIKLFKLNCLLDVIIYNDFIPGCLQNITIHLILK